jgi:hypothetical protein
MFAERRLYTAGPAEGVMVERRLLYLDATGLLAYAWDAGEITPLGHFAAGEEGFARFAAFLAAQPAGTLYQLLADLVEEAFHYETLPHVRGADRAAMLTRKRGQHLFGSPYATELSLGREPTGRRDERVLFVGLTRPAALEPWLEILARVEAPLAGIYTLPLLADKLPAPLGDKDEAARLLMVLTPAGIRQIFLERGRLRFSRLSGRLDTRLEGLAPTLAEEAGRTQAYLAGQRLIPRNEVLPVTVLASPADAAELALHLPAAPQLAIGFADLAALARQVGLKRPCTDSDALPLFLHWMVRRPGDSQLAPPAVRRFHLLRQARLAAYGLGTAAFLACLVMAAKLWVDSRELQREIEQVTLQTRADAGRYAALIGSLPPLPASLEVLQSLMGRIDRQAKGSASPLPALVVLSRALDEAPALSLESVEWRAAPAAASLAPGGVSAPAPAEPGPVELDARLRFPPQAREDRRGLVRQSEALVQVLRQTPGSTAQITRMPVELESDRTLRGGSDTGAAAEGPLLELRLTLAEGGPRLP